METFGIVRIAQHHTKLFNSKIEAPARYHGDVTVVMHVVVATVTACRVCNSMFFVTSVFNCYTHWREDIKTLVIVPKHKVTRTCHHKPHYIFISGDSRVCHVFVMFCDDGDVVCWTSYT